MSLLFLFILMCGALHEWFHYLVISGFSFIDDFSRISWVYLLNEKKVMCPLCLRCFTRWCIPNLIPISKLSVLTMKLSICPMISECIFLSNALSNKPLVTILRSRMVLLNGKIAIEKIKKCMCPTFIVGTFYHKSIIYQ
jgi:hypothetical protein